MTDALTSPLYVATKLNWPRQPKGVVAVRRAPSRAGTEIVGVEAEVSSTLQRLTLRLAHLSRPPLPPKAASRLLATHQPARVARISQHTVALDRETKRVDRALDALTKQIVVLKHLRPINAAAEKQTFFARDGRYEPRFEYAPLPARFLRLGEQLKALTFDGVPQRALRDRFEAKRSELLLQVAMLQTRGTQTFTRTATKVFGRPSKSDVAHAHRLLALPPQPETPTLSARQVKRRLDRFVRSLQEQAPVVCKVKLEEGRQSQAAATSRGVALAADGHFSTGEALRLAVHEVGWHVLTAFNGGLQPLKLLASGTAGYLGDQEGGAVLQELLTPGALSIARLQTLAARTVAVDAALSGQTFSQVYATLRALPTRLTEDQAYAICGRVFRGGTARDDGTWAGVFTKDALYLSHFLSVFEAMRSGTLDLTTFSAGKMTLQDVPFVAKAIRLGWLRAPRLLPPARELNLSHLDAAVHAALSDSV